MKRLFSSKALLKKKDYTTSTIFNLFGRTYLRYNIPKPTAKQPTT
jgi:hypothetical protein